MKKSKFTILCLLFVLLLGSSLAVFADTITVGFSQIGAESEWRTANTKSIQAAAEADPDIELIFSDGQQQQQNQIAALRSFIQRDVDVIAFSPVVETGWSTVLEEIKDAGIPLILVDRMVDADSSYWTTHIGSDFVEEGRKAGRWLLNYMEIQQRSYDTINIVELQGTVGSAPALDRQKGFMEVIEPYSNYQVIRSQSGDFTRALGREVMESFLQAEGDNIDVLFAHNDDMAIGAIQAIEAYGLEPGEDIIIIGVDAVRGAFEAMIQGKMNVTVECNPLLGEQVMDLVKRLVDGEELASYIPSIEYVYTQDNAAEEYPNRQY